MAQRPEDLAATLVRRGRRRRQRDEERLSLACEAVVRALRACLDQGTVARAWLIGTAAWGGAHGRSDVDVVVEGLASEHYGGLWDWLSQACGLDIDLLRIEDMKPRFRQRVLSEGVPVHGT